MNQILLFIKILYLQLPSLSISFMCAFQKKKKLAHKILVSKITRFQVLFPNIISASLKKNIISSISTTFFLTFTYINFHSERH